ncbi:unnamed protein product [Aureobasidium pullulans]|nr:unnamed protein product [Aureobasidium pullulans]
MPPLAQATALYAYNGTDPGDLELQPNDHINNALPQSAPTSYGNMPLEVSGQGDGSGKVPTKMQEGGNAAIFGAGATIGGNIVNSIF